MDGNDEKTKPSGEAEPEATEPEATEPEAAEPEAVEPEPEATEEGPEATEPEPQIRQPRDSSGEIIAIDIEPPARESATEEDVEEDLRDQLEKKQNQLLRVAADFDNYRKRSRRDAQDAAFRAKKDVLESLLPVIDNLELALSHAEKSEQGDADAASLREGVEMVLRQFTAAMEKYDVRPIESMGQAFDPNFHEALQQRETDEHPPGAVVEEYRRGYMLGDRLIRAAMVVVATAPAAAPESEDDEGDAEETTAAEDTGSGEPDPSTDKPADGDEGETDET